MTLQLAEKTQRKRQEVSGHDFSRAASATESTWDSAPATFRAPLWSLFRPFPCFANSYFPISSQDPPNAIALRAIARRNMPTKLISDIFPEFAVYFVKTRTINSCPPQPLQIPPFPQSNSPQTATIYPTPPPFSSHAYENNEVTSKKPKTTC